MENSHIKKTIAFQVAASDNSPDSFSLVSKAIESQVNSQVHFLIEPETLIAKFVSKNWEFSSSIELPEKVRNYLTHNENNGIAFEMEIPSWVLV